MLSGARASSTIYGGRRLRFISGGSLHALASHNHHAEIKDRPSAIGLTWLSSSWQRFLFKDLLAWNRDMNQTTKYFSCVSYSSFRGYLLQLSIQTWYFCMQEAGFWVPIVSKFNSLKRSDTCMHQKTKTIIGSDNGLPFFHASPLSKPTIHYC